ncbi:hypothetical protein ABH924_003285 [Arthrobacter sp. GAS37]|uniref:hypothetical protein n=1 Tax=Arthrobacter sp. GAS37 TaxID=3156261 RepID=UPI003837A7E5
MTNAQHIRSNADGTSRLPAHQEFPDEWLAYLDEPLRTAALSAGWAPDLSCSEKDDILNDAESALSECPAIQALEGRP